MSSIRTLGVLLAFATATASSLAAQQSRYTVRFSDDDRRTVAIEGTVAGSDTLLLMYPDNYDASHLREGWATFVRSLEVHDATGALVAIEKAGLNHWRVPASARRPLRIRYTVLVHHDQGSWPVGWDEAAYAKRECDCVFFTGMSMFIGARGMGDVEVRFDLPGARSERVGPWTSVAPWTPVAGQQHTYRASSFTELSEVALAVGRVPTGEVRSGDATIVIAVGRGIPNGVELFRDAIAGYVRGAESIFGAPASGRFAVIANPDIFTGGGAFIRSASLLYLRLPTKETRSAWGHELSHELTHLWNGHGIQYGLSEEWLKEGGTDYLARRNQLAAGDLTQQQFLDVVAQQYDYYKSDAGKASLREAGHDKQKLSSLVYGGAFITTLALDVEIRRATADRRTVEDVMKLLYRRHAHTGRLTTHDDIVRAVDEVVGQSLASFLQKYVAERNELPFQQYAALLGIRIEPPAKVGDPPVFRADPAAPQSAREMRARIFGVR